METGEKQLHTSSSRNGSRSGDFAALSRMAVRSATSDISLVDFLRTITLEMLDISNCDAVVLRVEKGEQQFHCEAAPASDGPEFKCSLSRDALGTSESHKNVGAEKSRNPDGDESYFSRLTVPLVVADETVGGVILKSRKEDFFPPSESEALGYFAQTLALVLFNHHVQASLRERVKELTCLYQIAQLTEQPNIQLADILQDIASLLPPAWQYPDIAAARIVLDGDVHSTPGYEDCVSKQVAPLIIKGRTRGCIEVGYSLEKPELDEGPFLEEERDLIDVAARQISLLVERRQEAEDRVRMQIQLRHADRLATIGQLSAGVAHELNEPLGNILAFAQLARKEPELPQQTARDLDKIVTTSLHAREIIKKLMLFARQMPPRKSLVNLNALVEDGLYFLEARCSKDGVAIQRDLSPAIPDIVADPSQLNQVLVNLVVNAIQAMPGGGVLKITTKEMGERVALAVEDNGMGMSPSVMKRIFDPFFTTKDINEGTGLGLPVVHGIVSSHGGTIEVESAPGRGSKFEVLLPLAFLEEDSERIGYESDSQ